jgi:hypothetical protein
MAETASLDFQCAVQRHGGFPVGANPTRQVSLGPEAIGETVQDGG